MVSNINYNYAHTVGVRHMIITTCPSTYLNFQKIAIWFLTGKCRHISRLVLYAIEIVESVSVDT